MRCPWCDFDGSLRPLHAHLAAVHPDQVRFEERAGGERLVYAIECPVCGAGYEQTIKPRHGAEFIDEYRREIRLVALDMLLNHLVGEHEVPAGGATGPDQ